MNYNTLEQYQELRKMNLRTQAMGLARDFASECAALSFEERKDVVLQVLQRLQGDYPYPLVSVFLEPSLREWSQKEPDNIRPWRWLGVILSGPEKLECLNRALRLEPNETTCQLAVSKQLMDSAEYDLKEISKGDSGESLSATARDLDRVESYLEQLDYHEDYSELKNRLEKAQDRVKSSQEDQ